MPRILVADDHAVVRKGLIQLLRDADSTISVDEAATGQEALDKALQGNYDMVLMDVSMPGRGGLEALKEIKAAKPRLPVLMLSMHPEEQYAVRALRSGASGYVTKDSAADELSGAVRKVLRGGRYVGAALAERLVLDLGDGSGRPLHESLSDREDQVMRMIASGKTVTVIAGELSLSVKTVSTYRARILEKMRVSNNAEIMRYAVEHGLIA